MPETVVDQHLEALPEEHRHQAIKKMESLHMRTAEKSRPLWDVDTTEVDRSVQDVSKFIELSVRELGPDASRREVEAHALELSSHYALAAQTWAESSPDSQEAQQDAEHAMESLLVWSMITHSQQKGDIRGIQPLLDRGYGMQLMTAAHRVAEKGLVIRDDDGFGYPSYRPISLAVSQYQEPLSFIYGRQLDPTVNDEYFGKQLTPAEQTSLLGKLTTDQIETGYGVVEGSAGQEDRAEALSEAYVISLVRENDSIDDRQAAEVLKRIASHYPDVLSKLEQEGSYVLEVLDKRAVGTQREYIHNNQTALRLHFLIARLLADPESPDAAKEFALSLISDRPDFEEVMIEWPLQFTEASEEGAAYARQVVQERAQQNELEAVERIEASDVPVTIGQQLDVSDEAIRTIIGNYKGDRRTILTIFESFGAQRELQPLEKTILTNKLFDHDYDKKVWDADVIKWKHYFDSEIVSHLSELFPTALPENLHNQVAGAINLHPYRMEQFIKSVDVLVQSDLAVEFAEGAALYQHADNVFSYILNTTHVEDSAENIDRINRLKQAGLFAVTTPDGTIIPLKPELLDALPANAEWAVDELRQVLNSSILSELLRDSPSDESKEQIIEDVVMHYETWGRAFSNQLITSLDSDLLAFVKNKVYGDGVPVSSFFEAIASLRIEDENVFDATILRSLIDRVTVDKLPTNPTKLVDRIPDARARELYVRILEQKTNQPDMSSTDIYVFLRDNGLMTDDEIAGLQAIDMTEKSDLTRLLIEKKNLLEDRRVRSRWLAGEYPDASLQLLASAWSSRAQALSEGVADNPYEIIRWTAVKKFYELAAAETEPIGGRSFTELLQEHGELAYELARNYSAHVSLEAMRKYFVLEAEGAFYRSEFTPGSVSIEYEGKKYDVDWLPKGSPYFFSMGVDTGCCMTIDGASESCIWQAMKDPNYGGMLVKVDGKVRAQSVGYLGQDESNKKTLVLDNIEVNAGTDERAIREVYKLALTQLLEEGRINPAIKQVNIGEGYTKVSYNDLESVIPIDAPAGVYTDARQQRRLFVRP